MRDFRSKTFRNFQVSSYVYVSKNETKVTKDDMILRYAAIFVT